MVDVECVKKLTYWSECVKMRVNRAEFRNNLSLAKMSLYFHRIPMKDQTISTTDKIVSTHQDLLL